MTHKITSILTILTMVLNVQLSFGAAPDSLIKAIHDGNEQKAISLITGTDLNAMDKDGNTALTSAAGFFPKITKALIDAKADPNLASQTGLTPLFTACRWGNAEMDKGLDINQVYETDNTKLTALDAAMAAGNIKE